MEDLRRRHSKKTHQSRLPVLFATGLGLLAVLFVTNAIRIYLISKNFDKERVDLARQINERESAIRDLKDKTNMLQSGEGVELEARSRLNLQKQGEHVLIIVDKDTAAQPQQEKKASLFDSIKHWFTGN